MNKEYQIAAYYFPNYHLEGDYKGAVRLKVKSIEEIAKKLEEAKKR